MLLRAPATATGTGIEGPVATVGPGLGAAPRLGRASTLGPGATEGAALACVACLARTTGTGLARPGVAPTPASARYPEGPNGSPCPFARAPGLVAGLGVANGAVVATVGVYPPATRRSFRACALGPAAAAVLAASAASTATFSVAGTPGLGRRRPRP